MRAAKSLPKLIEWIRESAAAAQGLLVPISGGSDSALGFWLCAQAFPEKTMGVHAGSALRCDDWFSAIADVQHIGAPMDHEAREELRWGKFLAMSLKERMWLVSCRNRTEDLLGTYSLASRVATFMPLAGCLKSDVMRLCSAIGVPQEIMDSSRRADPDCGRPPELAEIPLETIDAYLTSSSDSRYAPTRPQRLYLKSVVKRNAFKKALPIRGPHLP